MPKARVASGVAIKSKKGSLSKKDESNILLARGLSARYCGANTPLTSLTAEEMERDLRHMEAFSNACIAYSQQYFIYQNSGVHADDGRKKHSQMASHVAPQPLIAMPVRIDPEEEKRLATLRIKIQQCEAQREVLESQYLSLRAHYVSASRISGPLLTAELNLFKICCASGQSFWLFNELVFKFPVRSLHV